MDFQKCDWSTVMHVLRHEFGPDRAQDAAVIILEAQARGEEIYNPIEYGRKCCLGLISNEKRLKRPVILSLETVMEREDRGLPLDKTMVDTRDPLDAVAAREILESLPDALINKELNGLDLEFNSGSLRQFYRTKHEVLQNARAD